MIRSIRGWDKAFYDGQIMMCLVLKFKNPKDVAPVAEMLSRKVLAFQCGTDGHILYKNPQRVPIYDLPHFDDKEELSHYMLKHHSRPYKLALGALGVSDDAIAFNANHMLADGGYFKFIIDEISNGRDTPLVSDIPNSAEYLFSKKMEEAPDTIYPGDYDMKLTNFLSKDTEELNTDRFAHLIITDFPASSLKCYNKDTKKIKGLTEAIFSNFYATAVAYNENGYKCGLETCVDLRRYSNSHTWNDASVFSMMPIWTNVSPSDTLGQVGKKIRGGLNDGLNKGYSFSYLKALFEEKKGPGFRGNRLGTSNVGPIKVGGPLVDAYLGYSEISTAMPHIISITTWSIIGNGRNDITFRMKYNTDKVSTREAQMVSDCTIWGMQNIDPNLPLEKAIDELKGFQREFFRKNKGTIKGYFSPPPFQYNV